MAENEKKSLYEKIQNVRCELLGGGFKKSKVQGAVYGYIDLKDFVQDLNELMKREKMTAIVDFPTLENATITAIDWESDTRHTLSIPIKDGEIGGGRQGLHPMQKLGAVQTYARRYLYFALFDIAESDVLDGQSSQGISHNQDKKGVQGAKADVKQDVEQSNDIKNEPKTARITETQIRTIRALGFVETETFKAELAKKGLTKLEEISQNQALKLITRLEKEITDKANAKAEANKKQSQAEYENGENTDYMDTTEFEQSVKLNPYTCTIYGSQMGGKKG